MAAAVPFYCLSAILPAGKQAEQIFCLRTEMHSCILQPQKNLSQQKEEK
uniref:Uncharacterized protein n=1 Tax=Faecalibaculum rodentium TaxID=1702221 RepID=A0A140DWA2_9FIRM|nr:hypothetical protein AALO17_17950 [Faecalibaculum rodentium]